MKKTVLIIILLLGAFLNLSCQTTVNQEVKIADVPLKSIGSYGQIPLLIDDQKVVYKLTWINNSTCSAVEFRGSNELKERWPLFLFNDLEVYGGDQKIILYKDGKKHELSIDRRHIGGGFKPSFCVQGNYLIFALNAMNDLNEEFVGDNLRFVDLNNIGSSAIPLPLLASSVQSSNGFIYYSESILNEDGTITSNNIFKVKPGDWNKSELIVKNNNLESWIVFPDNTSKAYFKIYYKKKLEHIILDLKSERFGILPQESANVVSTSKEMIFDSNTKSMYLVKSEKSSAGLTKSTYLIRFPDIPTELPFKLEN